MHFGFPAGLLIRYQQIYVSSDLIAILMPNLGGGGAERVAVNLANAFCRRGYLVDIVLLSADGEFLNELLPEIRVVDLKVKRMRYAFAAVVTYLHSVRPSVMLANMWPLTVIALWARLVSGVVARVVVAEHTTWSRDEITSSLWGRCKVSASMRYTFPFADSIVTVSCGAADDLARFANLDRNKIVPIYNPIVKDNDTLASEPLLQPEWWSTTDRRILAVGSLSPVKDHATLLIAFSRLLQRVDARLLILGEGKCRFALEEQAKILGIERRLFMPGFVANPVPFYRHADLFVLSSTGEGFGNVIVEALAAGTPVVSTDCQSGPREILSNDKFGRLVPVSDADAMAVAMEESLAVSHDCDALKARAQDFSIDNAVDQYEKVLFPQVSAKGKR